MGNKNQILNKARIEKNDEFYTRYEDIENELKNYLNSFDDKIIYCNCDNPEWSQFYKYFKDNFHIFKLKKLISTFYTLDKKSYKIEFDGYNEIKTTLNNNGDFRSKECIEILKESDIVVTNPPFSLFRDFISLMIQEDKKFLIIGHQNNVTYKEVFNLIKQNKLWLGYGFKGSVGFFINEHYDNYAIAKDKKDNMIRVSGVHWFTNLNNSKRNSFLELNEVYNENNYPKYDNYDCIEVSKTKLIPIDYNGYMGVPISYLDKHCPEQFDICGLDDHRVIYPLSAKSNKINGKNIYRRIIIKRKVDL